MFSYVADGHCDFLYGMIHRGYELNNPREDQTVRLDHLKAGNVALQFFAIWPDLELRTSPLHQCIEMIDAYRRMVDKYPELVPYSGDFVPGQGKIATVLTLEGGEAINGSKAILRMMKRLGVAAMSFTWNDNNELCGAALDRHNKGLSDLGREILDEMNEIQMAVDVSHLSDRAIDDVLTYAEMPVFASHSNSRSAFLSKRSLSDDHIKEIAKRGGTVGVNFYYPQLCAKPPAHISDIVRHIRRIADVGGIDCCAIGSDFDGMTRYPEDMRTGRDFGALETALMNDGFSEEEVQKILYKNLARLALQFV